MFYVKRVFGKSLDWLHAWDDSWGTSCRTSQAYAMVFTSFEAAVVAAKRANLVCKDMPSGMVFVVEANEVVADGVVSLYLTRSGLVAAKVSRDKRADGTFGYRYSGKFGAGCGTLADIFSRLRFDLSGRRGITLAQGVDVMADDFKPQFLKV